MADDVRQLNKEEEILLKEYEDRWKAEVTYSDAPCDFGPACEAVIQAYQLQNQPPPSTFFLFPSAMAAAKAQIILCEIWDSSREKWTRPIPSQEELEQQVNDRDWDKHPNFKEAVRNQFNSMVYGAHDGEWLVYYEFFDKEMNLEMCIPMRGLVQLAYHCGWWAPFSEVAVLQDRPLSLSLVDEELHNPDGPIIRWSDGFSLWAIEGVSCNETIVMNPHLQTMDEIRDDTHSERKRIRIERYGWREYLANIGAKVLDAGPNEIDVTEEALLYVSAEQASSIPIDQQEPGDGSMTILLSNCPSTGRIYPMEIGEDENGNDIVRCDAAQLWLRGGRKGNPIGAS